MFVVLGLFFKKAEIRFVFLSWCSQAQSLLQWHNSHQYCSKTGQPTQRNIAGSKRVCHASGITYYPQVSIWTAQVINTGTLWWQADAAGSHGGEPVKVLHIPGYFFFSVHPVTLRAVGKAAICTYLLGMNFLLCFFMHLLDVSSDYYPGVWREPVPPRTTALISPGNVFCSVRLLWYG